MPRPIPLSIEATPSDGAFMRESWFTGTTDDGRPISVAVAWGLPKLCVMIGDGGDTYVVDVAKIVDQIDKATNGTTFFVPAAPCPFCAGSEQTVCPECHGKRWIEGTPVPVGKDSPCET